MQNGILGAAAVIPSANIASMAAALIIACVVPIVLIIIMLVRKKLGIKPLLVGAAIFAVCFAIAVVTAQIASAYIANTALLIFVLSLRAGIVEETGRLLAFRFILKPQNGWHEYKTAASYGVGHGFCEALLTLGLNYVSYIVFAIMINSGGLAALTGALPPGTADPYAGLVNVLTQTTPSLFLISGFERITAMIFHFSASIIVFYGVKERKYGYYLLAILLHTAFNSLTIPLSTGAASIWITELALFLAAISIFAFSRVCSKRLKQNEIAGAQYEPLPDGPADECQNDE